MHFYMKRKENEFFTASIQEIDSILQDREHRRGDLDTERLIQERLPLAYDQFKDVFSKLESNRLPIYRLYDHKIILEAPLPNRYSPLYR